MKRNGRLMAGVAAGLVLGTVSIAAAHDPGWNDDNRNRGPYAGWQMNRGGAGPGMMDPGMMGPGMMGPGGYGYGHMGPGMMGPGGYGYGHMGPGMMGPGMRGGGGYGYGPMGPGARGQWPGGAGAAQPLREDLSVSDVEHMLGHRLEWQGNPNVKLGDVEERDGDTIVAEIVTKDGSLVQRLEVNRHTGWIQPVR